MGCLQAKRMACQGVALCGGWSVIRPIGNGFKRGPQAENPDTRLAVRRRLVAGIVAIAVLSCVPACSRSSGPHVHDLSGTVTFDGEPVASGKMMFVPDSQQGNSGPAGHAEIRNGKFDTRRSGRGTVGGPHVVQIDGYSAEMETFVDADAGEEVSLAKPLFRRYEQRVDLPAARSAMDFDVPASAAVAIR